MSKSLISLGGSRAVTIVFRTWILTFAAIWAISGATFGVGQDQPNGAKPAKQMKEKKPAAESEGKTTGSYLVHQSIELGGRYTTVTGSAPMWATLVNQSSGGRVLGSSLEMHSKDPSKTHLFNTLSMNSTGYGGDPYDVSYLKMSKGRAYEFTGSFRRDRQYFDDNLLGNSLLGPNALVPEPDSLHLFNTVRRNTDANLTLLPLSFISFRAGFNHGTHEGPTFSTIHEGGDVQLSQWFRNAQNTYTGGLDVRVAKRTMLSYDQFVVLYKGDSSFGLTGTNFTLSDGTPVSLGMDVLSTATCGTGANRGPIVNGTVANPFCSGSIVTSETAPSRTIFKTEQLRFSSHYFDRVSMNGRFAYSGGVNNINNYNETFTGFVSRTFLRQEIDTGGLGGGRLSQSKRVNVNGDFGVIADLSKYVSLSDTFDFWSWRVPGVNSWVSEVWAGTSSSSPPNLNMLTPLSVLTPVTTTTPVARFLNQKSETNTILGTATIKPEFKLSAGWRYRNREIINSGGDDLTWHEQTLLLGAVIQPTPFARLNLNYDMMQSRAATDLTTSNSFTRTAPDSFYHIRGRLTLKPTKWLSLFGTVNDYTAKNDDPFVNHREHMYDVSFGTSIMASESFALDFNYAHDNFYSKTDICYTATPAPTGAATGGTCATSTNNPLLGTGLYDVPTNFFSGSILWSPTRRFRFNGGVRMNTLNGSAEQLNPLMAPGALQSYFLVPYADAQFKIAPQWTWHGNWTRDSYTEQGLQGTLPSRSTSGNITTLGVKYAF